MPEPLVTEYNHETHPPFGGHAFEHNHGTRPPSGGQAFEQFKQIAHAGEPAIDFSLPGIDGETVTLSELRGKPVVIEFGAIT